MLRSSLVALSLLVLALYGCRQEPPAPPEDAYPSEPMTDEDPIEGDPADIEGEELGEDQMDNAKVVDPGPAETEVQTGESFERPDGSSNAAANSMISSPLPRASSHARTVPLATGAMR
jgi:hypothetical protein